MKVTQVSSVSGNINFHANYTGNDKKYYSSNPDKNKPLIIGLVGLAIIGAASVGTAILKKNNSSPVEIIKNAAGKITEKLPKKQPQDPIASRLGASRDKLLYEGLRAQQKINSLETRYLNGEFNNIKDKEKVMNYIAKNKQELLRAAEHVC